MHTFAMVFGLAMLAGLFSVAVPYLAGKTGKGSDDGN